jgi:hypothetical protein
MSWRMVTLINHSEVMLNFINLRAIVVAIPFTLYCSIFNKLKKLDQFLSVNFRRIIFLSMLQAV